MDVFTERLKVFTKKWDHLPWKHWNCPKEQFENMPTFLIGEYLFYLVTLTTFLHAYRQGRQHMFLWWAALIVGSANDIFFMVLPFVDNFWQHQATIMLTPRMPLYIPCVYVVFLYISTVTIWRLGLPRLSEAALTGFFALLIYGPYDITGIKFLWWTWHDTDPPIKHRILGVPVGSSLWIIIFSASFSFVLRLIYVERRRSNRSCSPGTILITLLIAALVCTPLMMVQMAFFQAISFDVQGAPSQCCLAITAFIYTLVIAYQFPNRCSKRHPAARFLKIVSLNDRLLNLVLMVYFSALTVIMVFGIPEKHKSTGVHQSYGPCGIKVTDLTGLSRHQHVCAAEMTQDWDFSCLPDSKLPRSEPPTYWYTVCGKAHTNFPLWIGVVGSLSLVGHLLYSAVLGHPFLAVSKKKKH